VRSEFHPRLTVPVGARDHAQGPADAPVTLVEYGDFECPYCGMAYPIVKQVQAHFGDRLRFVFRHFPLGELHPYAQHAAEAAEAAGAQGKFWPMHDHLFEHQKQLDDAHLRAYAAAEGLDADRFAGDLGGHRFAERVREDFMSGVRSGVNGTPTFFVDGARHDGQWDADGLISALERVLRTRGS
jgi:protein-disulfide isomerase